MRQRVIFIVGVVFFFVCHTQAEDPIYIPDEILRTSIEAQLGMTDPTPTDMLDLRSLTYTQTFATAHLGIRDLTGLEYATNLEHLYLRLNHISSLSPISTLYQLVRIDVSQNRMISSLSPLQHLINLEHINVHGNKINDLSPLAGLTNVQTLIVRQNQISDLSPLSGLSNLQHLDCYYNNISNISPLSSCINLVYLDLHSNNISNISALRSLTNLTRLDLRDNPLGDRAYNEDLQWLHDNIPGIAIIYDVNPNPPVNIRASDCTYKDFVLITWDSFSHGPSYPTYYRVSRSTSKQGEINPISEWKYGRCSYEDHTCEPGIPYFYRVQTATSASGENEGRYSNPDGGWCDGTAKVCSLTISSTAGGSVIQPGEGIIEGVFGQRIQVKALSWDPNLFVFDHWTGTAVDVNLVDIIQPTVNITFTGNTTLRAHFVSTGKTLYVDNNNSSDSPEEHPLGLGTTQYPNHLRSSRLCQVRRLGRGAFYR